MSGYGFASPNGPLTAAGRSPSSGSSSRTRPARRGCRWCMSIRRIPPALAPSAGTSTRRTGSRRPGSRAGAADSLITQTATAPATSAPARGSCGDAGPRQRPPPHPRNIGTGLDANDASPPVMPTVQARDSSPGVVDVAPVPVPDRREVGGEVRGAEPGLGVDRGRVVVGRVDQLVRLVEVYGGTSVPYRFPPRQ